MTLPTTGGASYSDYHETGYTGGGSADHATVGIKLKLDQGVYGNSDTVQPPAYRVNVWRRTA